MERMKKMIYVVLLVCMLLCGCASVDTFAVSTPVKDVVGNILENDSRASKTNEKEAVESTEDNESVKDDEETVDASKVNFYESSKDVTGSKIYYVAGKEFEQMMDACRDAMGNPTAVAKKWIKEKEYERDEAWDIDCYSSEFEDGFFYYMDEKKTVNTNEGAKQYAFTLEGCQNFMDDVFRYMNDFEFGESLIMYPEMVNDICSNMPQLYYSEEDDCYYTYIQFRFEGVSYMLNMYMYGSDETNNQNRTLDGVDAELFTARYLEGGSGKRDDFDIYEAENLFFNTIFIEGVEYHLTGKTYVRSKYRYSDSYGELEGGEYFYENSDKSSYVYEHINFEDVNGWFDEDEIEVTEYKIKLVHNNRAL